MTRRRSGVAAVLVIVGLLAAHSSLAATPTPASGSTWAANQEVAYRWRNGAEPPAWMKSAVRAAAADSNRTRAARAAVFKYDAGATSWVAYTADIPTNFAVGYAVRRVPDSFNIRLRPHGHVLDWGTLKWCQFYSGSWPNGCYDAELITLHEFGHVQTLGHVDESLGEPWLDSIMHAGPRTRAKIGWNAHEYGRCDVGRLQIRYRALNSTTPYSTCLALPTTLSLSAASTSITPGSALTFGATLKVSASAGYTKLQGEPLSQRVVSLQRRVPGASSWTTQQQMTATSVNGRYTGTVSPTSTYEWRAVFSKPSSEGLVGSASPLVRVEVSKCVDGVCCSGPICVTEAEEAATEADESEEQ